MTDFDKCLAGIEKKYGKGSIVCLNDDSYVPIETFSTGSIYLDNALIIKGLPRGRIVEIFGPEGSGKSTMSLHFIAEAQKAGGVAAFIDAEHTLDRDYAEKIGVDIDKLLVSQPDNGEQALDIVEDLIRSGHLSLIVVDSVAALTPQAEIEGDAGDSHMGLHARLMSQSMRKLTAITAKSNTCLVFTNQIRSKIGVFFGSNETTTGGNALKFYSSIRLRIGRIAMVKHGDVTIGQRVKITVIKNKLAIPYRIAEFDIIFGEGINKYAEILDMATEKNIVEKNGSWYNYGTDRLGQGRDNVIKFLKENKEISDELLEKINEQDIPQKKG